MDARSEGAAGDADIARYASAPALEPSAGEFWHVFDLRDPGGATRLTDVIRAGLPQGLASLRGLSDRALLDERLAMVGSLENLSPGAAEELLALADAVSDSGTRSRIEEALKRDPVPDGREEELEHAMRTLQEALPEGVRIESHADPGPGSLMPRFKPGRRTAKRRAKLLSDLASTRIYARRQAAVLLGGWDGEPAVVEALRSALGHDDAWTRFAAAQSLGHLGDEDPETFQRVLSMVERANAGPRELGHAILQLANVDLPDRAEHARMALTSMAERYPAWSRDLRAYSSQLDA